MSETWVWNELLDFDDNYSFDNISFASNDKLYTSIKIYTGVLMKMYYDDDIVHNLEVNTWYNDAYRTITFSTAPTGDLLTFLQANAVKQSAGGYWLEESILV